MGSTGANWAGTILTVVSPCQYHAALVQIGQQPPSLLYRHVSITQHWRKLDRSHPHCCIAMSVPRSTGANWAGTILTVVSPCQYHAALAQIGQQPPSLLYRRVSTTQHWRKLDRSHPHCCIAMSVPRSTGANWAGTILTVVPPCQYHAALAQIGQQPPSLLYRRVSTTQHWRKLDRSHPHCCIAMSVPRSTGANWAGTILTVVSPSQQAALAQIGQEPSSLLYRRVSRQQWGKL